MSTKTYRQGAPGSSARCWTSSLRCGQLPEPLNAIEIDVKRRKRVVEVAHTGDNGALCIVNEQHRWSGARHRSRDTGEPIKVPVGDQCVWAACSSLLGVMAWTTSPPGPGGHYWPIRPAPSRGQQQSTTEILDRHQVVDLICPYAKGGKIGLFSGARRRQMVAIQELINIAIAEHGYSVFNGVGERTREATTVRPK